MATRSVPDGISLRSVALPVEHGGWGMLGEPLLLGLFIAPSWAGLGVALGALGGFLAVADRRYRFAVRRRFAAVAAAVSGA